MRKSPALVQACAIALLVVAIQYVATTGAAPFIYQKVLTRRMQAPETRNESFPEKTTLTIVAVIVLMSALPYLPGKKLVGLGAADVYLDAAFAA